MRVRVKKENFSLEYEGSPAVWNALLRPVLGGPEAPPEPEAPSPAPLAVQAPPPPAPYPGYAPMPPPPAYAPPAYAPPAYAPPAYAPPASASRPPAAPPPRPTPAPPPRAAAPPRRWDPPRREARRPEPPLHRGVEHEEADLGIEPSSDPATLYKRLSTIEGRRSEKEAVLAGVWFVSRGEREVTPEEVEGHLRQLGAFPDIKVLPHILKHVNRTKMLEPGSQPRAVRLTAKGLAHVRKHLVGA